MCALSSKVSDLKGRDLRAAVNNSIDKILEAVLESNLHIGEALDMIMSQVTHDKKQIVKDGGVSDAVLQKVLPYKVLSDVTVSSSTAIRKE